MVDTLSTTVFRGSADGGMMAVNPLPTQGTDGVVSGTITTQNLNPTTGVATAGSTVGLFAMSGTANVSVQVSGVYTGVLTPQVSVDGVNWIAVAAALNVNTNVFTANIASAAVGIWQIGLSGILMFRISANAAVTGTATISMQSGVGANLVAIDSPIITGTNTIGKVNVLGTGAATVDAILGGVAPTNVLWTTDAPSTAAGAATSVTTTAGLTVANIKAALGNVYGYQVQNPNASIIYLQFYNSATAPTLGTSVLWSVAINPNDVQTMKPSPIALANFAAGIGIGCATTPTGAVAPGAAPNVTIWYK